MKQSVTVGAQLLWCGRYGCNNGRYGCTIVMSYIEINKAVSQWLLTFNLCVSVTWPLTCAFHIPCTHTPEIIDMHRGVCDKRITHTVKVVMTPSNKQRVLMHGHQGWNVRHGLCHIYMIYVYIWVVYSFCLFCCLFIIVTTQFVALYKPCKPKPKFR